MSTVSADMTAVGVSQVLTVAPGRSVTYSATESTFVGIATFERSRNGGASWETIESATDASMVGGTLVNNTHADEWFRFRVVQNGESAVSGTLSVSVADVARTMLEYRNPDNTVLFKLTEEGIDTARRISQKRITNAAGQAKAGATAGWVVAAGANTALVTCPASQTGATLVVPINGLKVGDTITGFHLVGQIESAGGTVTVDADLRKHTAAAADVSDASVGAITQLSVTADAIMSASNTRKASLSEVVAADETFYVLLTATTAALTDIALQGVALEVTEG